MAAEGTVVFPLGPLSCSTCADCSLRKYLNGDFYDKCTGGVFYVSTDAKKNKTLQIEKNNEVSVGGLGWYAFQGTAKK